MRLVTASAAISFAVSIHQQADLETTYSDHVLGTAQLAKALVAQEFVRHPELAQREIAAGRSLFCLSRGAWVAKAELGLEARALRR